MENWIADKVVRGLYQRERTTKTSWVVKARVRGGKTITSTIGDTAKISPVDARKQAKIILAKTAQGINPSEENKKAKITAKAREFTLGKAIIEYAGYAQWKEKTRKDVLATLERRFGDWYRRPLSSITREDCLNRFQKIKKDVVAHKTAIAEGRKAKGLTVAKINNELGLAETQKAFRYLDAIINSFANDAAGSQKLLPDGNPILVLKDKKLRRVLKPKANYLDFAQREDLRHELWTIDLPEYKGNVKQDDADLVWLLLHTGMRSTEIRTIRWETIDFKQETLTAIDTKNGTDHTLPMTGPIKAVLKRRHKNKDSEYVFPSPFDNTKPMSANETFKRLSKAINFKFTAHDLRRTIATVAGELGYDLDAVGRVLNHKQKNVTAGYVQTSHIRLKTILEDVANAFFNEDALEPNIARKH